MSARSASSPPAYGSLDGFAPCPHVTPNPCGSNRALSAVQPRVHSIGRSPAPTMTPPAFSRSASPTGRTFHFPGKVDFTLDPTSRVDMAIRTPEGSVVYAQPGYSSGAGTTITIPHPQDKSQTIEVAVPHGAKTGQAMLVPVKPAARFGGGFRPAGGHSGAHAASGMHGQPPAPAPADAGGGTTGISAPSPEYSKPVVFSPYGKPLDVMEMFPTLFTTFCFGVFATPLILCFHIGSDPQVLFWIGDYLNWVLFLPVLFVWAHIWHTVFRLPSKFMMVMCLIGSCVVILVLSEHVLLDAYDRANELTARDCETFPRKMELQRSWEAANTFYANCMVSMADELDISYESAVATYRVEDCSDYATQLAQNPDWEYLAELEEDHLCAGWCERGHAIWTLGSVRDSCSATVADIMINKIRWTMLQVVVYTIIVLGVSSVMFVALGPSLETYNNRRAEYV